MTLIVTQWQCDTRYAGGNTFTVTMNDVSPDEAYKIKNYSNVDMIPEPYRKEFRRWVLSKESWFKRFIIFTFGL